MSLGAVSAGDTGYVLVSAALVMIMTPGLAFFYGGLVRRKNFLSIMMQSFISMGVVTAIWVIFGYSLAFGHDHGGIIGGLSYLGLHNVGEAPGPWAPHIPAAAHFVFQEMFAIITPALITGAFADRVKFKSYSGSSSRGACSSTSPSSTGSGAAASSPSGACSTSPAAWSCTSAPASPPWPPCSWSASAISCPASASCRTTWPSWRSARACCGSAGSASTQVRRSPPTASPRRPS